MSPNQRYCLDANVLIVAWQTYYAPDICPTYWDLISHFGKQGSIFLPREVYDELEKTEDELLKWVKSERLPIEKTDTDVIRCWQKINTADPSHQYLVDNANYRSLADPWVIAHAMKHNACVVTKEIKITPPSPKRVKIPNVCDNMGVKWIDDFSLCRELGLKFSCAI